MLNSQYKLLETSLGVSITPPTEAMHDEPHRTPPAADQPDHTPTILPFQMLQHVPFPSIKSPR
jgi:hypothetical protein